MKTILNLPLNNKLVYFFADKYRAVSVEATLILYGRIDTASRPRMGKLNTT